MLSRKSILQVQNLSVAPNLPNAAKILDSVSLDLHAGEILGIIGEAGSGKTVLARSLVNSLPNPLVVTGGNINYRGRDFRSISHREFSKIRGNEIGYIGANPQGSLDPTVPIGKQLIEKLRSVLPELSRTQAKERILDTCSAVHIPSPEARLNEFPFQFSGGMMQRVMIVDALVSKPTFLVADNITQALDVTVAAQINSLIEELRREFSTAIIHISSSLPMVYSLTDDVLVLQKGKIVERATPSKLVGSPQHAYTKTLLKRLPHIWGKDVIVPKSKKAPTLLKIDNVKKTYSVRDKNTFAGTNHVKAVRGVSLEIREGENIGIVGESGCGKSTLTRLLAWLEKPDQGNISFGGRDLSSLSQADLVKLRRSFQLLLQDPYSSLPARMPIGRIIAEPLLIHNVCPKPEIRDRVLKAMIEVGLDPSLENHLTIGLSAGQRQRINIARALVLEPKLMILDETLSALDQVEQSKLLELFDQLQRDYGITYIFISHDMALVRKVCHRIAVMYLGQFVEIADNETLFEKPGHPYSRALLSAVPTLDEHPYKAKDYLLDGEPPSPINIPSGCAFESRCPLAIEVCRHQQPDALPWSDEGKIACHLVKGTLEAQQFEQPATTAAEVTHVES